MPASALVGTQLKVLRHELDELLGRKLDDPAFDLHGDATTQLAVELVSTAVI